MLGPTAVAFLLFCVAASGVYLVNDTIDVEEDRRHPRKRFRPIAAGIVPRGLAISMAVVFFTVALVVAVLLTRPALAWVLGSYVVIQLGYCIFLKNQPVIDLAVVASGFLLRGIAGGVAAGLELSQWFLLVAAFGSLFMVAGKRYSELVLIGDAAATRKTLQEYSASYLRFVWSLSAAVTLTAYSLWAFEMGETQDGAPWSLISIAPFVLAILLYARDVDKGEAGAPEDIVLGDRVLLGPRRGVGRDDGAGCLRCLSERRAAHRLGADRGHAGGARPGLRRGRRPQGPRRGPRPRGGRRAAWPAATATPRRTPAVTSWT